ncbi:MAG: DUF58 domain-containing protein [Anaerolineae bacterium]
MSELPLILLLLLGLALLLRMDAVFYVIYVLAGTYALARWWTGNSLRSVRVSRQFTDHIFAGEQTQVRIEIANRSWWPVPWVRYEEAPPLPLSSGEMIRRAVTLGPKERNSFTYTLTGGQRGYYLIGPGVLRTGDLFGFAEAAGTLEVPGRLVVYPRVIPLARVELSSRSPHGTIPSQQQIFADPTRISGLRPYRSGDPWRSIDWKSTARSGDLQVKKYEPAISLTSVIFVDLNSAAYSRSWRVAASEWGIVVAASLASYLVGERQAVGVASNGLDVPTGERCWRIPPRPGRAHLMRVLEALACAGLTETIPLADWLSSAVAGLPWGTTAIVVTPTGDEPMCAALHRLSRMGLNPVLVVVEAYADFGVVRERARRLGIVAYQISDERDLRRWQTGRAVCLG